MRGQKEMDLQLIWVSLSLLLFGLVMVYSSSIALSVGTRLLHHENYFLMKQAAAMIVALLLSLVLFRMELATWQRLAPILFLLGLLLLVLTLIPGLGVSVNGARRWLHLGPFSIQASEFMKLAAVIYCADYTVRKLPHMDNTRRALLPMLSVIALVGLLLLAEPDFGSFAVIAMLCIGVLYIGGVRMNALFAIGAVLAVVFALLIYFSPYRRQRLLGFLDPWSDPLGQGYQLTHSLMAFGRGEWFGVGLGAGVEKLFYLPEAHTDFLLAVVGEEFGFVGVSILFTLYALLIFRIFQIGRQAAFLERHFPALLAQGVGIWLACQTLVNMGVNLGLLPTKGLTLPLMSYGGNSLLVSILALCLVLRVDYENRHPQNHVTAHR